MRSTDKYSGLSAAQARELLDYAPDTGLLTWKATGTGRRSGGEAGNRNTDGYVRTTIKYRAYANHRLAWMIYYGEWPKDQVDHIDGDRSNNRIFNLRQASSAINNQNLRRAHPNNKLGVLGVYYDGVHSKYLAHISVSGKQKYLGRFNSLEEASNAYLAAKRALHEGNQL